MNKNLINPDFLEPKEDPEKAFSAYMAEKGFDDIEVIANDEIHRFGDNKHGWYIMFPDGPCPAGAFGSFKTGEKYKWSAKNQSEMTPAERLTFNNQMAEAKKKREAEQARRNEAARKKAVREWDAASPAPQDHPYLQTKGVLSYGLKVNQTGQLVVPIRDNDGVVWSLQTIDQNGVKLFLPGGAKKGSYFTIGGGDNLYICEGYATGASLHEATGATVIIAFDSGNLKPVAQNIKAKYADRQIAICGDNDQWADGNPGVTKAKEAAAQIGARVVIPQFRDLSTEPTDFNDLSRLEGPHAFK
jgi:putative DNA primase/helicase